MGNNLYKIRKMYLSNDQEDKRLAYQWLCQIIGTKDANANIFILTFYLDWDRDHYHIIDDNNWWRMVFKSSINSFDKDDKCTVTIMARFGGVDIINKDRDYSRFSIAIGQPKSDFKRVLSDAFRKAGYILHQHLFL